MPERILEQISHELNDSSLVALNERTSPVELKCDSARLGGLARVADDLGNNRRHVDGFAYQRFGDFVARESQEVSHQCAGLECALGNRLQSHVLLGCLLRTSRLRDARDRRQRRA